MTIFKNIFKLVIISLFLVLLSAQSAGAAEIVRCVCVGDAIIGAGSKSADLICKELGVIAKSQMCPSINIPIKSANDKTDCSKLTAAELLSALKKFVEEVGYKDHKFTSVTQQGSCADAPGHTSPSAVTSGGTTGTSTETLCKDYDGTGVEVCRLVNPLKADYSANELIGNIIKAALGVVGALSLFSFFRGGFIWLRSFGNAEKIKEGGQSMLWSVLGLLIVFISYAVTNRVFDLLTGK